MQIVASFEAPIELLSVNKRTATEIKFEVQNTAAGRKAAFILGFKGGDVGASLGFPSSFLYPFFIFSISPSWQKSAARTRRCASRAMKFVKLLCFESNVRYVKFCAYKFHYCRALRRFLP